MEKVFIHRTFSSKNRFIESNLISIGGFGSIYKARIQDGMEVVVKGFNPQYGGAFKNLDVECNMMKIIRHQNLIKIISSCSKDDFKALILEYMPHGSLGKCLSTSNYILDFFSKITHNGRHCISCGISTLWSFNTCNSL